MHAGPVSATTDGMAATNKKMTTAVEDYLTDLQHIRASGGATGERSRYAPLANLLNAVGGTLKPKVFCVGELADQGAGHPDFGLYAAKQVQKGHPRDGQVPDGGVVEVKSADDDAWLTADSEQVSRYWSRYRLVLVTNTRDFVLLGEDGMGRPAKLEAFRLAAGAAEFDRLLQKPRAFRCPCRCGSGRVSVPGTVTPRPAYRTKGLGLAARLVRARCSGAYRRSGRHAVLGCDTRGLGGSLGRPLRGR